MQENLYTRFKIIALYFSRKIGLFKADLPPFELHEETETKTWFRKGGGDRKSKVKLDEQFFKKLDVYDDDEDQDGRSNSRSNRYKCTCFPLNFILWLCNKIK